MAIYKDANCVTNIADVSPPSVRQTIVPFHPGVPTKTGLYGKVLGGQITAEYFVDGYLVPVAQVPAS